MTESKKTIIGGLIRNIKNIYMYKFILFSVLLTVIFITSNVRGDGLSGGGEWFIDPPLTRAIIMTFLLNILLNALIVVLPLLIFEKLNLDKDVDSSWLLAVPLLSIVGAYIDALVFETQVISMWLGLFLVAISFFMVITIYMKHNYYVGIIISAIAFLLNYSCWRYVEIDFLEQVSFILGLMLIFIGIILVLLAVGVFINKTLKLLKKDTSISMPNYIKDLFVFLLMIFLIIWPFTF